MTARTVIARIVRQENLNFLLTNRIPRRWLTLLVGRLSRVRQPLVRDTCLALWRLFCDLDLSEARLIGKPVICASGLATFGSHTLSRLYRSV